MFCSFVIVGKLAFTNVIFEYVSGFGVMVFACLKKVDFTGTCDDKLVKLEKGILDCRDQNTGGIEKLSNVHVKASQDLNAIKTLVEGWLKVNPADVQDALLAESQQALSQCKQHKEGLVKTLQKCKILLDK